MRSAAATSTGSPARPARRASRATASRSTQLVRLCAPGAAAVAEAQARRVQLAAARTSGTSPPGAATARKDGPVDEGDRGARRAQLAARERPASTAPATTGRIRPPRSRCRSSAATGDRRCRREPIAIAKASSRAAMEVTRRRARRRQAPSRGPCSNRRGRARAIEPLPAPLVWTFDGPFERCLDDLDDSLRRAIVLIGDVSRVALLIDLSLPALLARVARRRPRAAGLGPLHRAHRRLRPADLPRVRHLRARRSAGDARRRLSQLICNEPESPPCP